MSLSLLSASGGGFMGSAEKIVPRLGGHSEILCVCLVLLQARASRCCCRGTRWTMSCVHRPCLVFGGCRTQGETGCVLFTIYCRCLVVNHWDLVLITYVSMFFCLLIERLDVLLLFARASVRVASLCLPFSVSLSLSFSLFSLSLILHALCR